jgi:hypothetical protein
MFRDLLLTIFGSSFLHAVVDRTIIVEVVTRHDTTCCLQTLYFLRVRVDPTTYIAHLLPSTLGNRRLASFFTMDLPHRLGQRRHTRSVFLAQQTHLKRMGVPSTPTLQVKGRFICVNINTSASSSEFSPATTYYPPQANTLPPHDPSIL